VQFFDHLIVAYFLWATLYSDKKQTVEIEHTVAMLKYNMLPLNSLLLIAV